VTGTTGETGWAKPQILIMNSYSPATSSALGVNYSDKNWINGERESYAPGIT
jgi:hypothetical protein